MRVVTTRRKEAFLGLHTQTRERARVAVEVRGRRVMAREPHARSRTTPEVAPELSDPVTRRDPLPLLPSGPDGVHGSSLTGS